MTRIRQLATRSFALLSLVLLLSFSPATIAQQKVEINEKRYDFAQLVNRLSEKAGYFGSDNLVSNELSYQHVLGRLRETFDIPTLDEHSYDPLRRDLAVDAENR